MLDTIQEFCAPTYLGYLWLIAGIILLILETGTPGLFFFVSLAMGTFAAAIAAFFATSIYTQCITSLIVAAVCFTLTKIFLSKKQISYQTNVHALIGQKAIVIESIEPNKIGRVKIKGEAWPAATADQQGTLHQGSHVTVVRIEGNKVIVSSKELS